MVRHNRASLASWIGKRWASRRSRWAMKINKTPCSSNSSKKETCTSSTTSLWLRRKALTICREDGRSWAHWIDWRPNWRSNSSSQTKKLLITVQTQTTWSIHCERQRMLPSQPETCLNHWSLPKSSISEHLRAEMGPVQCLLSASKRCYQSMVTPSNWVATRIVLVIIPHWLHIWACLNKYLKALTLGTKEVETTSQYLW